MPEYFGQRPFEPIENGENLKPQEPIGEREIKEAAKILREYQDSKVSFENRVKEDEEWWKLRHWKVIDAKKPKIENPGPLPRPTSAWLFNSLMNKHADAMDNYPDPIVLPRERSDEESAKTLTSILPVIMEYEHFDEVYDHNWWEKLKHGTSVYGVFWDSEKENGLGDIDIKAIDLMNIFWEPGITDVQKSRNLFIVELVENDVLKDLYPELRDKKGDVITVTQYDYDESIDNSEKSLVVDWYYKVKSGSRTVLHYVKFVGDTLLYASENDPEYAERGYYDHGLYPVVFDVLFPEKGMPVGFGYVAICKDPQLYIDKLSANILEGALMATKKRFFASESLNINESDFLDWNKPIVKVAGSIDQSKLQEINVTPLAPIYQSVLQMKIEEMKDTSSNRDVNQGSSGGGITAAAAIAALQEAGNKSSRDMIQASYRSYQKVVSLCIELIRQFYDEKRSFRITGEDPGQYEFIDVNNFALAPQPIGTDSFGNQLFRKPVFDLKIKAQRKNPFSRMEENERAKELYGMGFFNPERAQEALAALEMMDFEGIDKVKEQVQQGQTLINIVQQMQQQMQEMAGMLGMLTGTAPPQGSPVPEAPAPEAPAKSNAPTDEIMASKAPMTSYGERLAKRSRPDISV